jgi:hypothetical protein
MYPLLYRFFPGIRSLTLLVFPFSCSTIYLFKSCYLDVCGPNEKNNGAGQGAGAFGILSVLLSIPLFVVVYPSPRCSSHANFPFSSTNSIIISIASLRSKHVPLFVGRISLGLSAVVSLFSLMSWVIYIGVRGASDSGSISGPNVSMSGTATIDIGFYFSIIASVFYLAGIISTINRCYCGPLSAKDPDSELLKVLESIDPSMGHTSLLKGAFENSTALDDDLEPGQDV